MFSRFCPYFRGAALEIWGEGSKVVFSGDLGQFYSVMEGSPPVIERADFVVIESTYGNRRHRSLEDTRREFSEAIEGALSKGGKVLIPSFVVDRAQRIIYELFLLQERLDGKYPVFLIALWGSKSLIFIDNTGTFLPERFRSLT